jgi:DNA-binding MarR family transcriptional regulator
VSQDSVDRHIEHWSREIPDLDPFVEGIITRMQMIVRHLKLQCQTVVEAQGLEEHEYSTLHMLGGCGPDHRATPGEIAAWLRMSPAAITGRIDNLERRGLVRRLPSSTDRRKIVVELTEQGRRLWRAAGGEQGSEEARILSALSPADREQLSALLRQLMHVVDRPGLLPTPKDQAGDT